MLVAIVPVINALMLMLTSSAPVGTGRVFAPEFAIEYGSAMIAALLKASVTSFVVEARLTSVSH